MTKEKVGRWILIALGLVSIGYLLYSEPILQPDEYHNFADQREILEVPNFWNVISNLPFLLLGILGIRSVFRRNKGEIMFLTFFLGIALVAFGSGYYHFQPTSETLVWDRLPMTVAFMALYAAILTEYVSQELGKGLFVPLLVLGFASILIWVFSGDLRTYVFVQFYPILTIPVILLLFPSTSLTPGYWYLLLFYAVAKGCETFDGEVHELIGFSGHSLKHLFVGVGLYIFYRRYKS